MSNILPERNSDLAKLRKLDSHDLSEMVAKAMGWEERPYENSDEVDGHWTTQEWYRPLPDGAGWRIEGRLPDFSGSLDACLIFENWLSDVKPYEADDTNMVPPPRYGASDWDIYCMCLRHVTNKYEFRDVFKGLTARQKCMAFVLAMDTIGKELKKFVNP